MNNKVAINTYVSTIESKNKTLSNKKNRDRIMDMESILMVTRWVQGMGHWVKR